MKIIGNYDVNTPEYGLNIEITAKTDDAAEKLCDVIYDYTEYEIESDIDEGNKVTTRFSGLPNEYSVERLLSKIEDSLSRDELEEGFVEICADTDHIYRFKLLSQVGPTTADEWTWQCLKGIVTFADTDDDDE